MIIYAIPRHDDTTFNKYINVSVQKYGGMMYEIKGENDTISQKYQIAVNAMKQNNIADDDIVVFTHEDVQILDEAFVPKVQMLFQQNSDLGMVGIAGSTELPISGGWWHTTPDKMRGHLIQGNDTDNGGNYLKKGPTGFYNDLVCVDGCFMVTTGRIAKNHLDFDINTFKDCNDFYDINICLHLLKQKFKIAVANIMIYHKSSGTGALKATWEEAKDKLIDKYTKEGYTFPLTKDSFINKDEIVEIFL